MTIERAPAPSEAVCTRCAGPVRAGARFCVACGAPVASGTPSAGFPSAGGFPSGTFPSGGTPFPSAGPAPFVPAPRGPMQSGPFGPPAPIPAYGPDPDAQRTRTLRIAVIVGTVLVVVAAVIGTVIVARQSMATQSTQTTQAAPAAPSSTTGTGTGDVVGTPSDPTAQLRAQQEADNPAAESAVGAWVPQLSAKKVGLVADGQTYDAASILADHQRLRAQYSGAMLVWSGDWASFKGSDFWVTLAGQSFATPEQANSWCASAGFDADHCYAKRLSHSGGYAGNTVLRN